MTVTLVKGQNVSLNKEAPGLKKILVGLGWDVRQTQGSAFDLDVSVFIVNSNSKVKSDYDFIFYNNLRSKCGSVEHLGDNRTGVGDGDDESIKINLDKVPFEAQKISITVSIYDALERKQNFGMVNNAYIHLLDEENNTEICRYDLSEEASIETSMIFAEFYKYNNEWKFKAVGQGFKNGLEGLCQNFGVNT